MFDYCINLKKKCFVVPESDVDEQRIADVHERSSDDFELTDPSEDNCEEEVEEDEDEGEEDDVDKVAASTGVGDEEEDGAQDGDSSCEDDQYRGWEDDIVLDGESASESVIIF